MAVVFRVRHFRFDVYYNIDYYNIDPTKAISPFKGLIGSMARQMLI
jgi:hypothetical protein